MENLAAYITSENANMDILLKRTWSKVDDGNGPDGVYRSHIMTFPSPSKISIYPYSPSSIIRVTNLEVAFGVSSWGGNTSPKTFYIQYTNDPMASVNDSTTDNKWITVKSYTSWNHQSGIVNIPVDFTCRKMRIVVDASYQSTYYQSTVFRVYGEIKNTKYLFQDGTEIKKYVSGTGWTVVGTAPATKAMFDSDGINDLSIIDNNAIQQLTSDTPELLCWIDETGINVTRQTNITAVPLPQLILPVEDIEVGEIEGVKVETISQDKTASTKQEILPVMSNQNDSIGVITSNRNTSTSGYQEYCLRDGNVSTRFSSGFTPSGSNKAYLIFKLSNRVCIDAYTITPYNTTDSPKDFTLLGSNDGINWVTLDAQTNQTSWSSAKTYAFNNNNSYSLYKLEVSTTNGGWLSMLEFQLLASPKGNTDIKIIVSGDSGINWKGKNSLIDISDLTQVKANGFTPDELNALNKEELATLFPNGKVRFAFYLEQEKSTDIVQIDSLKINEKQYTMTPSIENLSVLYELLESEKPAIYVSRDDGVNWKEVQPDTLTKLDDLPEGNKLRVKIVLQNGQELHGLSYSWI